MAKETTGRGPSTQVTGSDAEQKANATNKSSRHRPYTYYSIMQFPSWAALKDFANKIPYSARAEAGNKSFEKWVTRELTFLNGNKSAAKFSSYGLDGKHPKTYAEAMARETFVYMDQYKRVKEKVDKLIKDWRLKSEAESEKPKLVFNDKEIGEFVFSKAAMALMPKLFYYSPSRNEEIDIVKNKIKNVKDGMVLESDGSKVVFAFKVKRKVSKYATPDELGTITKKTKKIDDAIYYVFEEKTDINPIQTIDDIDSELIAMGYKTKIVDNKLYVRKDKDNEKAEFIYVEAKEDIYKDSNGIEVNRSLKEATKLGIVQLKSSNKKVYLYKEKKPKIFPTVKLIIALKAGGFTAWKNDLYTGVTAMVVTEVLESMGYCVGIEIVVGGGRCPACGADLSTPDGNGRRFFSITAKGFDQQLDQNGLLYMVADPSFHNIKWMSYVNYFFSLFKDDITSDGKSPLDRWHGIEKEDLLNPLGMFHKKYDESKGNKNLLHFYIHQVGATVGNDSEGVQLDDETANIEKCVEYVRSIVEDTVNLNKQALEKLKTSGYDFGFGK